jgi:hypothetical protein
VIQLTDSDRITGLTKHTISLQVLQIGDIIRKYIFVLLLLLVLTGTAFSMESLRMIREKINEKALSKIADEYNEYRIENPKHSNKFLYERDSLLIYHTVKEYIRNEDKEFRLYNAGYRLQSEAEVFLEDIFYSPDSLKCISLVIFRYRADELPSNAGLDTTYVHDGVALLGCRNSKNELWKIYKSQIVKFSNYLSYTEVYRSLLWVYLTDKIQTFATGILNKDLLTNDLKKRLNKKSITSTNTVFHKYNVTDDEFWNDIMFIKDNRVYGLYDFQTRLDKRNYIEIDVEYISIPNSVKLLYGD